MVIGFAITMSHRKTRVKICHVRSIYY